MWADSFLIIIYVEMPDMVTWQAVPLIFNGLCSVGEHLASVGRSHGTYLGLWPLKDLYLSLNEYKRRWRSIKKCRSFPRSSALLGVARLEGWRWLDREFKPPPPPVQKSFLRLCSVTVTIRVPRGGGCLGVFNNPLWSENQYLGMFKHPPPWTWKDGFLLVFCFKCVYFLI